MGEHTEIAWCHHTFNPWEGCQKVSAGCHKCYASARNARFNGGKHWGGDDTPRLMRSEANWAAPKRWNKEAIAAGERRRVFCASLADVFEDREDLVTPRARLFALIEATPGLDWLLLTKRPENMIRLAPPSWAAGWPGNVWAGATTEDQPNAERRLQHLLKVPAVVLFVSAEPLLGPLDLCDAGAFAFNTNGYCGRCGTRWKDRDSRAHERHVKDGHACPPGYGGSISWSIIGGESAVMGSARRFELTWASAIIGQCRGARAAPFFKQAGSHATRDGERLKLRHPKGGDLSELPGNWPREFPRGLEER